MARRAVSLMAAVTGACCLGAQAGPPTLLAADAGLEQLFSLDPNTGAPTLIGALGVQTVASLAWDSHRGILYATSTSTQQLLRVNPQTGAATAIGPLGVTCCMHGLEYNPSNGVLYGLRTGTPGQLYAINPATGAATFIAALSLSPTGGSLAFDPGSGVMYLSEVIDQRLHTVNLVTGATTLIGTFNAPGNPFAQVGVGMAFDPVLGLLATDNSGLPFIDDLLYRVNTATGVATLIGPTQGSNMLGLAFVGAACYPDCNADGGLNLADFGCFQTRYGLGAAYADCNGDGVRNLADFGCFQTKFALGCP